MKLEFLARRIGIGTLEVKTFDTNMKWSCERFGIWNESHIKFYVIGLGSKSVLITSNEQLLLREVFSRRSVILAHLSSFSVLSKPIKTGTKSSSVLFKN